LLERRVKRGVLRPGRDDAGNRGQRCKIRLCSRDAGLRACVQLDHQIRGGNERRIGTVA